ncbi:MAG: hypothetical protein MJ250_08490 [Alphaproteobacteria bacterium]|nr:hypothetical protein [Alphaproteobacteria bacterium]
MTLVSYGKLPETPAKLTAFTSLDDESYNNYVIFDTEFANSDKTPLTVSNSKDFKPTLGTIKKKFNTVGTDQLFTIVNSSGYTTGQSKKHAYFCELKANEGYQFSETSEIVVSYTYTNPFSGSTVPVTEKIPVTEKSQTVYIYGYNQKTSIGTPKDITATNLIEKPVEKPVEKPEEKPDEPVEKPVEKPVETVDRLLNVYRMNSDKLKTFKESTYQDSNGAVLKFSSFIESIKPLKLNFDNLDVETGVKIGNNTLTDFTLPNLKTIKNVKVASFNLSKLTNKNEPVISLYNPFVKPFQLKNVNLGSVLDIFLTWDVQKDLLEFDCYQNEKIVFTYATNYSDKVSLYQNATNSVINVNETTGTYDSVFYLQIETEKIDENQKVFKVDSYKHYNELPNYFTCDNVENVNIPEDDFDIVKRILKEGVYRE